MKKNKFLRWNILGISSVILSSSILTFQSYSSLKKNNILYNSLNNSAELNSNYKNFVKENINEISDNELIEQIISSATNQKYLGDLVAATNFESNTIDLEKLIDLDNSNGSIVPAYLKINGEYTSNIQEAKISHIQNPVIKYIDNNNNEYDSEYEALNAISNDFESYSNTIAYYEIIDYSSNNKTIHKINPLNTSDVNKLKELALINSSISGNEFDIVRYKINSNNYYNQSSFQGISNSSITQKVNVMINELLQNILDNTYLSISNSFTHNEWYFGFGFKTITDTVQGDYFGINDGILKQLETKAYNFLKTNWGNDKITSFQLVIDQHNFNNQNISSRATTAYNNAYEIVMRNFNYNSSANSYAKQVAEISKKMVSTNFLNNTKISTDKNSAYSVVMDLIQSKFLSYMKNQLDTNIFVNSLIGSYKSLQNYLTICLKNLYQENPENNGDDVKYIITYNNSPLFLIGTTLVDAIKNTEDFAINPVNTFKKYFNNLYINTSYWKEYATNHLINISNSFNYDQNKNLNLNKQNLINNYYNQNKFSNFQFENNQISNSFNSNVKMIDQQIYSNNNINVINLEKQLLRREEQDLNLLNSNYGTFQAIYEYNKTLSKIKNSNIKISSLIDYVNQNAIIDSNNVVFLYTKNKTPQTIKFGSYINYGFKFNVSLTDTTNKIINSTEKLRYEFYMENLEVPLKQYNFYDYDGNLITKEIITNNNGSFSESEKNAWNNAINKFNLEADQNYVYYVLDDNSKSLVKNQINNLYIVYIPQISDFDDGTANKYYGFTNFNDLQSFVANYVLENKDEQIIEDNTIEDESNQTKVPVDDSQNYIPENTLNAIMSSQQKTLLASCLTPTLIVCASIITYLFYIKFKKNLKTKKIKLKKVKK